MVRRKTYLLLCSATVVFPCLVIMVELTRTEKVLHEGISSLSHKIFGKRETQSCFESVQPVRQRTQHQACSSLGFYRDPVYGLQGVIGNLGYTRNIYVSHKYNALFCLVPKASSNNWVKTLLILEGVINSTVDMGPREIVEASRKHLRVLAQYRNPERVAMVRNYTTVVFVRNPYTRLLSAFRDRLEAYPNRNPWHRQRHNKLIYMEFGNHSSREMPPASTPNEKYNVTFKEFIDYYLHDNVRNTDVHWREQYKVCPPCFDYDYIGKMETYADDFKQILSLFGTDLQLKLVQAPHATNSSEDDILRKYYGTLSDDQMNKLEKVLRPDMKLFGYSIPEVIQRNFL